MRLFPSALRRVLDVLAARGVELRPAVRRLRWARQPAQTVPGLVSVIMPVRDRAGLAPRAVASVLAQSYRHFELIVIDDGSRDGLRRALKRQIGDRRIILIRRQAQGAAAARNAGLAAARGALVAYLDSDNEWLPGFLAGMVQAFAAWGVRSAYGIVIGADGARRFAPFDRAALLRANFIDLNAFMHRRDLGIAFDERLRRLIDWDFILHCTAAAPAMAVPVLAVTYHEDAPHRISATQDFIAPLCAIRRKWQAPLPDPARPVRVLYALWQYPQASEMYVETELLALRRRGVAVQVWSEVWPSAAHATQVPVHRGTLAAAIAAARPDVVHTHWLNMAAAYSPDVTAAGLPYTVRAHGFEVTAEALAAVLRDETVKRVYAYRDQPMLAGMASPKLRRIDNAFETSLFRPGAERNHRLVMRASAALAAKDLELFLTLAKRLPSHRFVLAIVSCTLVEDHVGELLARRRELASPAEIMLNLSHGEVAALMGEAGIYLHTLAPPETPPGTPLGQPGSIAEAMASGCLVLHRRRDELINYAGDPAFAYDDDDEAAALITATLGWDDDAWARVSRKAVERAWTLFSGDETHDAIYRDWVELAGLS